MKYLKKFESYESPVDDENIEIIRDILRDISDNDIDVNICQYTDHDSISIEIGERAFDSFKEENRESDHNLEKYLTNFISMNEFIENELDMYISSIDIFAYHTLDGIRVIYDGGQYDIRLNSFEHFLDELQKISNIDYLYFYYTTI